MGYKFVDHTADVAAEISGESYSELFFSAFRAWADTAFDVEVGSITDEVCIRLSANSAEELLHSFLDELNYMLLVKKLATVQTSGISVEKKDEFVLESIVRVVNVDKDKVLLKAEIKAVTFHRMDIVESGRMLSTLLVFDI